MTAGGNPFHARWTRKGNNLCLGRWEIRYQERLLELPADRRDNDMGTLGIYNFMDPDDPEFTDGLSEDDWLLANMEWLADLFAASDIPIDEQHMRWLYQALNAQDWRCGSCGGCI